MKFRFFFLEWNFLRYSSFHCYVRVKRQFHIAKTWIKIREVSTISCKVKLSMTYTHWVLFIQVSDILVMWHHFKAILWQGQLAILVEFPFKKVSVFEETPSLLFCICVIFLSFFYWGVPEERNMSTFKDEEELYQHLKNLSWTFVWL